MTLLKPKLPHLLPRYIFKKAKYLSVAVALLLSAPNVFALGLGSLEISSNLDEPLQGTIQLRVSDGDNLDSVTASIASREDFESLGIDYPSYLENFSIILDPFGDQRLLRINSNNVIIKEPFIHFLVRVEWSGGSFLREYTALIDPPVYAAETPDSISEPKEVGTDQLYQSEPQAVPTVAQPQPAPNTPPAVDSSQAIEEDTFYNDSPQTEGGAENIEYSSASLPLDATYGPVQSGESLSVIAQDLQTQFPDLSIYQIMKVLFEENVDSFIGANINGLIQGSVLRIGDLNAIRSVDIAESKAFYSRQIEEWNPQLLQPGGGDSINVGQDNYNFQDDSSFTSDSSGFDDFDTQGSFQVGASNESNDYVSSDQEGSRDGEVLALRQEITALQSSLASSELENIELSERISLLEGQLADMNRLAELNIESADLANIESTLAEQNDTFGDAESVIEEFTDENDSAGAIDEFLISNDDTIEVSDEEANAAIDELVDQGIIVEDLGQTVDTQESVVDAVQSSTSNDTNELSTVSETSVSSSQPEEESILETITSMLFDGGLWKILAGLGAILVAGAGLLFLRRRRADEEFEISMLSIESNSHSVGHSESTEDSASLSASHTASLASEAVNADKETSFLTVYSDSDAVVQADEVDPVAEADVYIAYGRDEQAEEVLLDGIVSHPERIDIKQKLLNLYHKRQNEEGFERVAEELYSQRAALTGDMWQQVCDMGKEIAPNNPLFELSGDDLNTAVEADEEANSELLLEGDSVSEVIIDKAVSEDDSLAFDVDDAADDLVDHLDASPSELEGTLSIEDESELVVGSLTEDESIQLINFDDGRSEISELDEVEIDALEFGDDTSGAVDLSDAVDDDLDLNDLIDDDVADIGLDGDDEFLDFNVDVSSDADQEESSESTISEVQEVSDLEIDPDYDESRTQYELAKVFVDLGDGDGARKILVELVDSADTSSDVLHDAKVLLESIDA